MEEVAQARALGVGRHGGLDLEREGKCSAALTRSNFGRGAIANRVEERKDLEAQWFAGRHFRLYEAEARGGAGGIAKLRDELRDDSGVDSGGGSELRDDGGVDLAQVELTCGERGGDRWRNGCADVRRQRGERIGRRGGRRVIHADDEDVAAGVVDGDVLAWLKEAQLAHSLGGDAGGGEVGHATGFELDADVGDVDFGREDGQADGADFAHGRGGKGKNDVEVVDHEVEDDVNIEGTGREDAEAMRLKEHGALETRGDRKHRGIEALEVAGLNDKLSAFGAGNEVVGLGEICGQGLFDEQVDAGIEEPHGDGVMMDGRHGDAGSIEIEIGGEEFFDGGKDRDLVLRGCFPGASRIGLDGGNKRDALTGRFQFAIDAEMVAAECARAGDGDAQLISAGYCAASFSCGASRDSPWTALRQRP